MQFSSKQGSIWDQDYLIDGFVFVPCYILGKKESYR